MDITEKDTLITRILSGYIRLDAGQQSYLLTTPSRLHRFRAQERYNETLKEAQLREVISATAMFDHMIERGLWSLQKQERLDGLIKDIDEIKVKLFQLTFKSDERRIIRAKLREAEDEINRLSKERHTFDYATAEGIASLARFHYLLLSGLRYPDETPVWTDESFLEGSDAILELIISAFHDNIITTKQYRELARSEPWRTEWAIAGGAFNAFGKPVVDLTEEQKQLAIWSITYDNVRENVDSPHDSVIEDDDMLDGWMILQKRKRDAEKHAKQGEDIISKNPRIQNASDIFIVCDNIEDAAAVEKLNTIGARIVKQQRFAKLQKDKVVKEQHMPDVVQQLQMDIAKRRGG